MRQGWAQSRRRCGGVGPVPAPMWAERRRGTQEATGLSTVRGAYLGNWRGLDRIGACALAAVATGMMHRATCSACNVQHATYDAYKNKAYSMQHAACNTHGRRGSASDTTGYPAGTKSTRGAVCECGVRADDIPPGMISERSTISRAARYAAQQAAATDARERSACERAAGMGGCECVHTTLQQSVRLRCHCGAVPSQGPFPLRPVPA